MPNPLKKFFKRTKQQLVSPETFPQATQMTHGTLKQAIEGITYWEDKINYYKNYDYLENHGVWVNSKTTTAADIAPSEASAVEQTRQLGHRLKKVNYGCGGTYIEGWLNIDLYAMNNGTPSNYRSVNLLEKHPFDDNVLNFGFSEDFLEHINQAESIFFLSEVYRTLAPGGVLRLSFPGLEGVLERHYTPASEARVRHGELEAYSFWDHIHFYAKGEIEVVARHLGFTKIEYPEYGISSHLELSNLDTREGQIGLNTYVELTK
jgi:predicted SAM-dependent methyltransferase